MSGKIIVVPPSGLTESYFWLKRANPAWEILSKYVDGYIESVLVRWEGKLRQGYVNEDGHMKRLPRNAFAENLMKGTRYEGQMIVGNLVIWVPDYRPHRKAAVVPHGDKPTSELSK